MGNRGVQDVNGKMIINALESIGQPATAKRICSYIANSAGVNVELIKDSVDSVLKGGLDNGFIRKHLRSYYIESMEDTEVDVHYYICKKCRNEIQTTECAIERTKETEARAGAAKALKKRRKAEKTTTKGQNKKPAGKNEAPKQADSKVKSVAVLNKKKELNAIRNIRALRFGNKSQDANNASKPQEKKVSSKRGGSKIKPRKGNESKVLERKMGSFSVRARKASERQKKLSKKQPTDATALERKIRAAQKVASKTKKQNANKSSPIKDCGNDGIMLRSGIVLKNINLEPKNKEQKNSESINKDKDKNLASKENKLAQKPAKAAVNTHEASNGDRQGCKGYGKAHKK